MTPQDGDARLAEIGPVMRQRLDPRWVVLALVCLLVIGGVVLGARYLESLERPPTTYYEAQIQRWEALLTSKSNDPAIWATLGSLYSESGDAKRADRAFARALELDPGNPAALVHVAKKESTAGNVDKARSLLTSATASLPIGGKYLVMYELGELERKAGREDAALKAYEASVADNGTFWNAPYRLAVLYERRGKLNEALAAAVKARMFMTSNPALDRLIDGLESKGATATVAPHGMGADKVQQ